jgi:photosystem II stability/assembly factor-like uncharacterized protein
MKKFFITSLFLVAALTLGGASCISLSGSTATGPIGMFFSSDKGESWKSLAAWPTLQGVKTLDQVSVYRLIPDPQDSKTLYWLSREQGLFYTYNAGASWQHPETGPFTSGYVYSLAVHPQIRCTMYATNGVQVFQTVDCGREWNEVYRESRSNTTVSALTFNPFRPYQIFVAMSNGDILESGDAGYSWTVLSRLGGNVLVITADPHDENVLYVATRTSGLYRSTDGGYTWKSLKSTMDEYTGSSEFRRLVVHPNKPGVLYWISTYGILISTDRGDTWRDLKLITPPGSAQIYGFAVNPNNDKEIYYTATINNRSTFYRTEDGGQNWITKKLPSNQVPTLIYVSPTDGNQIYLGFSPIPQQANSNPLLGQ